MVVDPPRAVFDTRKVGPTLLRPLPNYSEVFSLFRQSGGEVVMELEREKLISELQSRLSALFHMRYQGVAAPAFARAQGYVDGTMQLLIDSGMATRKELLSLVLRERQRALIEPEVKVA